MIPPGDIRNCLLALSPEDSIMTQLLHFRFETGDLAGHSFGNLFLAALSQITGDFAEAVRVTGDLLDARGEVVPASLEQVCLKARLSGGKMVEGQWAITSSGSFCEAVFLEPEDAEPNEAAINAIENADLVVLGPGSLFTSIIPNLLFRQIREAIHRSSAPKLFICNVMTQPGETSGFSASAHLASLIQHAGTQIADTMLVNTAVPPPKIVEFYRSKGAEPVTVDEDGLSGYSQRILSADVGFAEQDYFRHDSDRLATAVTSLLGVHRS